MLFLLPKEGTDINEAPQNYTNRVRSMAKQILSREHTNHLRLLRQKGMQHRNNSGKYSYMAAANKSNVIRTIFANFFLEESHQHLSLAHSKSRIPESSRPTVKA